MLNTLISYNKKTLKLFIVFLMFLSMVTPATQKVNAYDYSVPKQFTRIKKISYPEWWGRKIPGLASWSTYMCKYNGKYAFCLEAENDTPASGQYPATVIENNSNVRKLLYYGFGGPAPAGEFADGVDLKNAICPDDSLTNDEVKYLLTHIFLSGAYSGQWKGFDEELFNKTFGGNYGSNIMGIYRRIIALPDPIYAHFNPGNKIANFTSSIDLKNNQQKTNIVKFEGNDNSTIHIPLQDNVTIYIDNGSTQTGGTVTVHANQSFYFTAPLKAIDDYSAKNINGNGCEIFTALAIHSGVSGTQTEGSWHLDADNNILNINIDWLDVGKIELTKTNINNDFIDGSVFTVTSKSYQGFSHEVTVTNGKIIINDLLPGTYSLKEKSAPNGYLLNTNSFDVVVKANATTTQTIVDDEPSGQINLTKSINSKETDDLLGDAYLKDNEYQLIARSDIKNKAGTVTYFKKGDIIDSQKTNNNGQLTFHNLHIGNYTIKEIKSNPSLVLNNQNYDIDIEYAGQSVTQIIKSQNTENKIAKQKFEVFKFGEDKGVSGIVKGLPDTEFTFKLKSEVDNVGWDNATVYDVVTTDESGLARTKYLPYGKYLVRETKTPEGYKTAPDFIIAVEKDYSEYDEIHQIKKITVNNAPYTARVKMIKKDFDSKKNVTLNSAVFRIKDKKTNEYISQKVGNVKYSYFTTNSNHIITVYESQWASRYDESGTVVTPLELKSGEYEIEEILTPDGFLELEEPVTFKIGDIYDYTDEDNEAVVEVVVKNKQPKGEFNLDKSIQLNKDVDLSLMDTSNLSKIEFTLYAKKDIVSVIDGSILYKEDTAVEKYHLSTDGKLHVSDLPMGEYYIKETKTLDGLVLDDKTYDIIFKQKDLKTEVYTVDLKVKNKPTVVSLSKIDVGGEELPGASMSLLDKDRNVITQWISSDKPYIIEGLPDGKYILHEDLAPLGYTKATDIEFEVKNTSVVQKVKMTDKQVEINKVDSHNQGVMGVKLHIIDEDKKVIDEWITDGTGKHYANHLEVNKTYTLEEVEVPDGYVKASPVTFTVENDGKNQSVKMIDLTAELRKTDKDGNLLKGVEFEVISSKTKNIVDRFVTGQHIIDIDDGMKDAMKKGIEISDYLQDNITWYHITPLNKDNKEFMLTLKHNEKTSYYQIDISGNETTHHIQNLSQDAEYILRETKPLKGYVSIDEKTFKLTDKDITFNIVNETTKVKISKQDVTTSKELPGAHLKLEDITDLTNIITVKEFVSGDTPTLFEKLEVGHKYRLTETIAPDGYQLAQSIEFVVKDTGKVQKIIMKDELKPVEVKTGDNTNIAFYLLLQLIILLVIFLKKRNFINIR